MKQYWDTEHDCVVYEWELYDEYQFEMEERDDKITFAEYLENCMTYNNGTLERMD